VKDQPYKKILVGLGARSYPIYIGRNLEFLINKKLQNCEIQGRKAVAMVDVGFGENASSSFNKIIQLIPSISLPSGEKTKSAEFLLKAWNFLASHRLDRTSEIFAFGGGVTGDLSGFAAASYLRGVDFYQIPTTLLAMVDSSVGGKTGINLDSGKNLIGAFHQPKAVFIDLECLKTLPVKEFSAGMAEVIKYGMLGNVDFYKRLLSLESPLCPKSIELGEIIESCCLDKGFIVESDEKENIDSNGGRALLNLGHTFAHAIEAVAGYGKYLHGEAVAIGLICALRLSAMSGYCEKPDEDILRNLLQIYSLPTRLHNSLSVTELRNAMYSDKKVASGKLRFVLMKRVGEAFVTSDVELEKVDKVWRSVGAV